MKVSILIPCHNAGRWVGAAVKSALAQTWCDKEVVVVDDGSTDGSRDVIRSFGDAIRWEFKPNRGANVARNRLLELATGSWLQYLDADDYLLPGKIEGQLRDHDCRESDVVYSPHLVEETDSPGASLGVLAMANVSPPHDLWLLLIRWQFPQTGGLLFRRQTLADIGGWKEGLKNCQDYELYARLLMAKKRFAFCSETGAVYRWWCSGTVTHRKVQDIYRDRLKVQEMIEDHLLRTDQMTPARHDAILQARFEYARQIYRWDRRTARAIVSSIRRDCRNFQPTGIAAPPTYRLAYRAVGFTGAESLARLKRRLWA